MELNKTFVLPVRTRWLKHMDLVPDAEFHFLLKFFGNSSMIHYITNTPNFLQGWHLVS